MIFNKTQAEANTAGLHKRKNNCKLICKFFMRGIYKDLCCQYNDHLSSAALTFG